MVVEYGQILCSAAHLLGVEDTPYKPTHVNHPCVVWASASKCNYRWLIKLFDSLAREYKRRWGRVHLTFKKIDAWFRTMPFDSVQFPEEGPTPFALAMNKYPECMGPDPVASYRAFYIKDKAWFATWKYGPKPYWWPTESSP